MKRSPLNRAIMLVLALVLTCSSVLAVPQTAEAASKPKEITLSAKKRTLYVGKSFTLKVKSVKPAKASKAVTFKSSNTKVATVNSKGKVTGKKVGKATITVTSSSNKKVKATCKITVKQQVTDIEVTNAIRKHILVPKGKSLTLKTKVSPKNAADKSLEYAVRKPKIVTVNSKGKVKANKYGTTRVAVQSKDQQKKIVLTVYVPKVRVKSMKLNATSKNLDVGKTFRLKPTFRPEKGTIKVISYKSSNPEVAYVSVGGNVRGVKPGKAVVTATTLDGKKVAKCTFKINPIKVKGVTVIPETQELIKGQQFTVSAKITPSNATNQSVSWKSTNTNVISITQAGLATAVGVGEAEIIATAKDGSGKSGKCKVTVLPEGGKVLIKSIEVIPSQKSLTVGESTTLEAKVTLDDGTVVGDADKDKYPLSWISDRPDVATVEPETGKVTAVAEGKANISAVARDGSGEMGTCYLDVKPAEQPVAPVITLTEEKINLEAGKSKDLTWTVTPEGTPITWNSNNESVASVENGKVTAIKAGTAIITASAKGGNTVSCTVNVLSDKPEIALTEVEVNLQAGGSLELKWAVSPADAAVTWTSDRPEVATVDNGKITAVSQGTAIITASVEGGNTVRCTVNVLPGGSANEIILIQEELNMEVGGTAELKWSVRPEGAAITWASDNPEVATVENGRVTAVATGVATITASVAGGNTVSCVVNVKAPGGDVTKPELVLQEASVRMQEGQEMELQWTVRPEDAKVTWRSSNNEVASYVDGKIVALKAGTADITGEVEGGNTVTCHVTVVAASTDDPVISLTEVEVDLQVGAKTRLSWAVNPENTPVTWETSDDKVATVDNGEITAVGTGTAIITAKAEGGNSVTCTVNVVSDKPELKLEEESLNLAVGVTRKLNWVTKPEGMKVTWASDNNEVATVSEDGVVTAVSSGTAIITGTVDGGNSVSCTITVTGVSIILNEKEITLKANQEEGIQLTATLKPEDFAEAVIVWASSDESVAKVSENGLVTPRKILDNEYVDPVRDASITATAQIDGQTVAVASCKVTVITEKNAEVLDDDNFIYILEADAVAYRIVRGSQEVEVTKEQVMKDMALFAKKLNEVQWNNDFVKNYWDRLTTETLKESEILSTLFLGNKPEIKDINATTKEITMNGRTVEVKRVDGQSASSLVITDKNGGRQAYVDDIQAKVEGNNVKITAAVGTSASGKRTDVQLNMSLDGKNITFNRLVNGNVRPVITFSEVDNSFEFKVDQTYYDEFVDMFGSGFDFLNQVEIYNLYI